MQLSDSSTAQAQDRESLRSIAIELGKHFPQLAEETEVVLMEISPHLLHAYWHITPWDLESARIKAKDENTSLVMRFHDLTDRGSGSLTPPWFDIDITGHSGNQYVELWHDAQSYEAELGLLSSAGKLIDLTRSNRVELPRAGHAPISGTQVLTLTPLADELFQQPTDINRETTVWRENPHQPRDLTLLSGIPSLFPVFPGPDLLFGEHQPLELPVFPMLENAIILAESEEKAAAEERLSPPLKSESTRQSSVFPSPDLLTGEYQPLKIPVYPKTENAIILAESEEKAAAEERPSPPLRSESTRQSSVFPRPDPLTGEYQPLKVPVYPKVENAIILTESEEKVLTKELHSPPLRSETIRQQAETVDIKEFPCIRVEKISELAAQAENISVKEPISLEKAGQIPAASDLREVSLPLSISSPTEPVSSITLATSPTHQPVSSFKLGQSGDEELHIELHIRGRKQPNSQFVFFGQAIPTREDGTFSLSKTLPPHTLQLVAQLLAAIQEHQDG